VAAFLNYREEWGGRRVWSAKKKNNWRKRKRDAYIGRSREGFKMGGKLTSTSKKNKKGGRG